MKIAALQEQFFKHACLQNSKFTFWSSAASVISVKYSSQAPKIANLGEDSQERGVTKENPLSSSLSFTCLK